MLRGARSGPAVALAESISGGDDDDDGKGVKKVRRRFELVVRWMLPTVIVGFMYALCRLSGHGGVNSGPRDLERLQEYMADRISFPVLLVAHNRPGELDETIESLLKVRGVLKSEIVVAIDGEDESVLRTVKTRDLKYFIRERVSEDAALDTSKHYGSFAV